MSCRPVSRRARCRRVSFVPAFWLLLACLLLPGSVHAGSATVSTQCISTLGSGTSDVTITASGPTSVVEGEAWTMTDIVITGPSASLAPFYRNNCIGDAGPKSIPVSSGSLLIEGTGSIPASQSIAASGASLDFTIDDPTPGDKFNADEMYSPATISLFGGPGTNLGWTATTLGTSDFAQSASTGSLSYTLTLPSCTPSVAFTCTPQTPPGNFLSVSVAGACSGAPPVVPNGDASACVGFSATGESCPRGAWGCDPGFVPTGTDPTCESDGSWSGNYACGPDASPDAIVELVWTETTGSGTPGGATIDARTGEVLTLDIVVHPGVAELGGLSLSLAYDETVLDAQFAEECPSPALGNVIAGLCGGFENVDGPFTTGIGSQAGAPGAEDVDGDGFVGMQDVARAIASFGQSVPPADPALDQDSDGVISAADIAQVLRSLGAPGVPGLAPGRVQIVEAGSIDGRGWVNPFTLGRVEFEVVGPGAGSEVSVDLIAGIDGLYEPTGLYYPDFASTSPATVDSVGSTLPVAPFAAPLLVLALGATGVWRARRR